MMKKDDSESRGGIARKETGVSTSAHGFVLSGDFVGNVEGVSYD